MKEEELAEIRRQLGDGFFHVVTAPRTISDLLDEIERLEQENQEVEEALRVVMQVYVSRKENQNAAP